MKLWDLMESPVQNVRDLRRRTSLLAAHPRRAHRGLPGPPGRARAAAQAPRRPRPAQQRRDPSHRVLRRLRSRPPDHDGAGDGGGGHAPRSPAPSARPSPAMDPAAPRGQASGRAAGRSPEPLGDRPGRRDDRDRPGRRLRPPGNLARPRGRAPSRGRAARPRGAPLRAGGGGPRRRGRRATRTAARLGIMLWTNVDRAQAEAYQSQVRAFDRLAGVLKTEPLWPTAPDRRRGRLPSARGAGRGHAAPARDGAHARHRLRRRLLDPARAGAPRLRADPPHGEPGRPGGQPRLRDDHGAGGLDRRRFGSSCSRPGCRASERP